MDRRTEVAENGGDLVVQTNLAGLVTYLSSSVEHLTGFNRDMFVGRSIVDMLGLETATKLNHAVRERIRHPARRAVGVECAFTHRDGRKIWFEARPSPRIDAITGKHIGATDVLRDITENKIARAHLEFANVLLKVQMEASPGGIIVLDADSKIASYNEKFWRMWGVRPEDLRASNVGAVLSAASDLVADATEFAAALSKIVDHPTSSSHGEIKLKDGRWIDAHSVAMSSEERGNLGRAFFFLDITEHKRALAYALHQARFDGLTDLVNRVGFVEAVTKAIAVSKRHSRAFAVMFLDLDEFKSVNDRFGHAVGDELLKQVAVRLKTTLRETDLVSRFGGDEFAILISDVRSQESVETLAAKLVSVLSAPFLIQGRSIQSGASIGVELHFEGATDADTLLLRADIALYRVKAMGRGRYCLFDAADAQCGVDRFGPAPRKLEQFGEASRSLDSACPDR